MLLAGTLLLIFSFVFIGGFFIPVPQDAILVLAGYYASVAGANIVLTVVAAGLAVIASDAIIYGVARAGSPLIDAASNRIAPQTMAMLKRGFERHPARAIFLIRLMIGLRIVAPILAGSLRMPLKKFLKHNLAAVIVYVPLFTALGYFSHDVAELIDGLTAAEHSIAIIIATIIALSISYALTRRIRKHFRKEVIEAPKPS